MGQPAPAPVPQPQQQFAPNPYVGAETAYAGAPAPNVSVNFGAPAQDNYAFNSNAAAPAAAYNPYGPQTAAPNASFPVQAPYDPQARAPGPAPAYGGLGAPGGQFGMFQQPIVQDMALQYGQRLADQGKQLVESHFEKYVPVTRLKYYFAVDNNYVINKLRLIFFPFTHKVSPICCDITIFTIEQLLYSIAFSSISLRTGR